MRVEHVCGVFGQGRGGRRDKGKLRGNEADDGANERRETESLAEVSGILESGNVWVFVQLIHRPIRTKNQLYKNPNIA